MSHFQLITIEERATDRSLRALLGAFGRVGIFIAVAVIPYSVFSVLCFPVNPFKYAGLACVAAVIVALCALRLFRIRSMGWRQIMLSTAGYLSFLSCLDRAMHPWNAGLPMDPKPLSELNLLRSISRKVCRNSIESNYLGNGYLIGKSVNELVAMGVLTHFDAAYLKKHQIKFYGFDSVFTIGTNPSPLFEETVSTEHGRYRIICYFDSSGTIVRVK